MNSGRAVTQLKKDRTWSSGMPWRTPHDFSMTWRTMEGEIEWAVEIWEKPREREGIVKSWFRDGLELELGLGFLRWWSLIRE